MTDVENSSAFKSDGPEWLFDEDSQKGRGPLKTLALYMLGLDPRKYLAPSTYIQHREALLERGYDISSTDLYWRYQRESASDPERGTAKDRLKAVAR